MVSQPRGTRLVFQLVADQEEASAMGGGGGSDQDNCAQMDVD
jgi:hypothetical protein